MAWPFSTAVAPNLDTGVVAVPTSLTTITASACWLMGGSFTNTGSVTRTVQITDGASTVIAGPFDVPPGVPVSIPWPFMPLTGLRWVASGAGITGKIWGYI